MRHFIYQIPCMDEILMGYWVDVQVRTMLISVTYKSKFRMMDMTLRRVLINPYEMFLSSHWGIPGEFLCLEVVGVDLMALGMHFGSCVSLRAPVPGLIVSLGIYAELGQEGLGITLVLDSQKSSFEVISYGKLLVDVSLDWWFSSSSTAWLFAGLITVIFWLLADPLDFARAVLLEPPILFSTLVFPPTPLFGYSKIQGGRYLM